MATEASENKQEKNSLQPVNVNNRHPIWKEFLFTAKRFLKNPLTIIGLTIIIIFGISYFETNGKDDPKAIVLSKKLFETGSAFNISAVVIMIVLVFLYALFW